jgi:hypothetical protein
MFNNSGGMVDVTPYHSSLVSFLRASRLQNTYIYNCSMDQEQFWDILEASKYSFTDVYFYKCKIGEVEERDMSQRLEGATFNRLLLHDCGGSNYSNWGADQKSLMNIILSLGKSQSVKDNMKNIHLGSCGVAKQTIQQALNTAGLPNVTIQGI